MIESKEPVVYAHPRMHQFLERATAEGAHLKVPRWIEEDRWIRNRNVLGAFYGSPATLEDVGNIFGMIRERVRRINKVTLKAFHQNCSPETRKEFPLSELPLKKPMSLAVRIRASLSHGGRAGQIAERLKQGQTLEEIVRELSLARQDQYRTILKDLGVDIPAFFRANETIPRPTNKLEVRIKTDTEDKLSQLPETQVKLPVSA